MEVIKIHILPKSPGGEYGKIIQQPLQPDIAIVTLFASRRFAPRQKVRQCTQCRLSNCSTYAAQAPRTAAPSSRARHRGAGLYSLELIEEYSAC